MSETQVSSFSLARVGLVAVPLGIVVAAGAFVLGRSFEKHANQAMQQDVVAGMLSEALQTSRFTNSGVEFVDADNDLVADPPAGAELPEKLVFSYIAEPVEEGQERDLSNWEELTAAMSEAAGVPVEATHYRSVSEQLQALVDGEAHLVGLSTGAVPLAVKSCGVAPLCRLAGAEGVGDYRMMFVAAKNSGVQKLTDLKGRKVVFVRPTSNSGFKAPFLALDEEAGLLPERDYQWSFSLSHEDSVRATLSGEAAAAPVASDIFEEMKSKGEVNEDDCLVIYQSEAFPSAVIGCTHQLPAETIASLRQALIGFSWSGTGVEKELGLTGAQRFIGVDYKNDWALIRRINNQVAGYAK